MKTPRLLILLGAGTLVLAAGCAPPPQEEDEIQKTLRMAEQARRGTRPGGSRNVYVTLERLEVSRREESGLATMWRYANARVTVAGGNGFARGGIRMGMAGEEFEAQLTAYCRKAKGVSRTTADILVLSGSEGQLFVGRDTFLPTLRVRTAAGKIEVLERVRVGTSLLVLPRILEGGNIELELVPSFSVLGGAHRGRTISATSLRTRVVVAPGRKLVLGSSTTSREDTVAAGLFGYSSKGEKTSSIVTVKAVRP